MGRAFRRSREELVITLSVTGLAVLIVSSIMYYAEHAAQPGQFSMIPAAPCPNHAHPLRSSRSAQLGVPNSHCLSRRGEAILAVQHWDRSV